MTYQTIMPKQGGRTLLELMISITIGLAVLAALMTVYISTSSTSRQSASVARMSEDAAILFSLLGVDLHTAGFSPPRLLVSPGGAIVNGVKMTTPDRNFVGAAIRGCDKGFTDATKKGAFTDLACADISGTGAASFAIRFESDPANGLVNTSPVTVSGVIYPSNCLNEGVKIKQSSAIDPTDAARNYFLVDSRYFVGVSASSSTTEMSCAGIVDGVAGTDFNPQPLVQYVENMIISYGVAQDAISTDVVRYMTAKQIDDELTGDVDARWVRVVSVKICLLMMGSEPDASAVGSYIDCAGNTVTPTDGRARRAFSSVFALRNRSGLATGGGA